MMKLHSPSNYSSLLSSQIFGGQNRDPRHHTHQYTHPLEVNQHLVVKTVSNLNSRLKVLISRQDIMYIILTAINAALTDTKDLDIPHPSFTTTQLNLLSRHINTIVRYINISLHSTISPLMGVANTLAITSHITIVAQTNGLDTTTLSLRTNPRLSLPINRFAYIHRI